jgi:hypothetical protein
LTPNEQSFDRFEVFTTPSSFATSLVLNDSWPVSDLPPPSPSPILYNRSLSRLGSRPS